jgi:hypothetical protein
MRFGLWRMPFVNSFDLPVSKAAGVDEKCIPEGNTSIHDISARSDSQTCLKMQKTAWIAKRILQNVMQWTTRMRFLTTESATTSHNLDALLSVTTMRH